MEMLATLLPFVLIFGVFWFFLIRPQQKQQKERKEMLGNLQAGDDVVTIGGIKGKIIKIKEDNIRLRISSNVDIDMVRDSIARVASPVKVEEDQAEDNDQE
ncbi:MAG TPA: preprotein translocase subunit YajC [Halanaerobiales bacterium]|nr:preprotein translocase subunit YajC [Halanaerobiales bacterium]